MEDINGAESPAQGTAAEADHIRALRLILAGITETVAMGLWQSQEGDGQWNFINAGTRNYYRGEARVLLAEAAE